MRWWQLIYEDFSVVSTRDPAARGKWSILTLHTGFWAVVSYRIEHALWQAGWHWFAQWLSLISRWITGVEIHPAVCIGRRLFIDHGMGIVIGETAELGDDVSLYQGVTLGGTSWARGKRHPTIGNNVIIGAGAKVIGAIRLEDNVRVGSNAVVVRDVPKNTTVVGIPAKAITPHLTNTFLAYAQDDRISDPVLQMLTSIQERLDTLEQENQRLRQTRHES